VGLRNSEACVKGTARNDPSSLVPPETEAPEEVLRVRRRGRTVRKTRIGSSVVGNMMLIGFLVLLGIGSYPFRSTASASVKVGSGEIREELLSILQRLLKHWK
jgi:hypothetical protein